MTSTITNNSNGPDGLTGTGAGAPVGRVRSRGVPISAKFKMTTMTFSNIGMTGHFSHEKSSKGMKGHSNSSSATDKPSAPQTRPNRVRQAFDLRKTFSLNHP